MDEKRDFFNLRQAKVRDFKSELLELAKKPNGNSSRRKCRGCRIRFGYDEFFQKCGIWPQNFNHSDSYWKIKIIEEWNLLQNIPSSNDT